jgi:hypothetical protein
MALIPDDDTGMCDPVQQDARLQHRPVNMLSDSLIHLLHLVLFIRVIIFISM